jgi:hypothetical protein
MDTKRRGPQAPRLAAVRSRWLDAVIAALQDDQPVVGVALVGSLGGGRADDWSDIDLLVVVEDAALDDFVAPDRLPSGPGQPTFAIDARHNGPRGTRAVSAQYVVDRLPLWVDWHVHPVSLANWPSDCSVVFDPRGVGHTRADFSEYLNRGQHEPFIPKSPEEHQAMQLALIPIAGKQLARRSPEAARTIEFLGGPYEPEATWQDQLASLRRLLEGFTTLGRPDSLAAAHAFLALLEEILYRTAA